MPDDVTRKLNAEFNAALAAPDAREKLVSVGMTPMGGSAESFTKTIHEAREQFAKLVKARGIKIRQ